MTISKACKELIIVQPFYGFFLLNINKEYTTRVPTLAVSPNGVNIKLLINEKFWNSLNDEAQLAVLTHEIMYAFSIYRCKLTLMIKTSSTMQLMQK